MTKATAILSGSLTILLHMTLNSKNLLVLVISVSMHDGETCFDRVLQTGIWDFICQKHGKLQSRMESYVPKGFQRFGMMHRNMQLLHSFTLWSMLRHIIGLFRFSSIRSHIIGRAGRNAVWRHCQCDIVAIFNGSVVNTQLSKLPLTR
jgi:hypothetical protein